MSLTAIRNTRMAGQRPALVFVVIGPHAPVHDDNTLVLVADDDRPEAMDWRPLVGLPVVLIQPAARPALAQRAIDAMHEVGVNFIGTADPLGALPLDDRPGLEQILTKAREQLCPR